MAALEKGLKVGGELSFHGLRGGEDLASLRLDPTEASGGASASLLLVMKVSRSFLVRLRDVGADGQAGGHRGIKGAEAGPGGSTAGQSAAAKASSRAGLTRRQRRKRREAALAAKC